MLRTQLTQRVARLESRCEGSRIQTQRERAAAKISQLTPDERRARIRLLTHRLMKAQRITPAHDESLTDAAVRAACTMTGFSTRLIPTLRGIFDEQPVAR
jgi:hypothetical protein